MFSLIPECTQNILSFIVAAIGRCVNKSQIWLNTLSGLSISSFNLTLHSSPNPYTLQTS